MREMKWIRSVLLGGVALGVAAGGAQASEIDNLAKKVEALEKEILALKANDIVQANSNGSVLMDKSVLQKIGDSIKITRGTEALADWALDRNPADNIPVSRGFTISYGDAQPTADPMGAQTVITVGGYTKLDAIYDFDNPLGNAFNASLIGGSKSREEVRLHANQSRLRVKASTDTPLGNARALLEGDFYGGGGGTLRLRHAWGELDISDNITLGFGRYWRNSYTLATGYVSTVDFNGPAGVISSSRGAQIRLSYHSGPASIHFGVENPTSGSNLDQLTAVAATPASLTATAAVVAGVAESALETATVEADSDTAITLKGVADCPAGTTVAGDACITNADKTALDGMVAGTPSNYMFTAAVPATETSAGSQGTNNKVPDLSVRVEYDIPGGHFFNASGLLRFFNSDKAHGGIANKSKVGWVGSVGANVNLGDIATLTANFIYGNGAGNYLYYSGKAGVIQADGDIELIESFGIATGLSFSASDSTSLNVGWGWTNPKKSDIESAYGLSDSSGKTDSMMTIHGNIIWQPVDAVSLGWEVIWGENKLVSGSKHSALRGQFGAWFYF